MSEKFKCDNCKTEVEEKAKYCPSCGGLFIDAVCEIHKEKEAAGVCLVCNKICCSKCGLFVNGTFLCNQHSDIEIFESMGRVYGSSDSLEIDFLLSVLETEELHPFRYERKTSPISVGGTDYSLFRASGEYDGHIINEIKILVPLNEYLKAKAVVVDYQNRDK